MKDGKHEKGHQERKNWSIPRVKEETRQRAKILALHFDLPMGELLDLVIEQACEDAGLPKLAPRAESTASVVDLAV